MSDRPAVVTLLREPLEPKVRLTSGLLRSYSVEIFGWNYNVVPNQHFNGNRVIHDNECANLLSNLTFSLPSITSLPTVRLPVRPTGNWDTSRKLFSSCGSLVLTLTSMTRRPASGNYRNWLGRLQFPRRVNSLQVALSLRGHVPAKLPPLLTHTLPELWVTGYST